MGKGIVKLGEGQWAVKDGNLLAAKETNGRFKNTEFTVSRGTRASYVGRDGLIKDASFYNLIDYSEDFTDSSWNFDIQQSYLTRTANAALSPSGNNDATKLISNNITKTPSTAYIAASTSASSPYTTSVFAKKGEYDYLVMSVGSYASGFWGSFNLSNGTVDTQPTEANTSASIESYGNGWYRCLITTTTTSGLEICLVSPSVDGGIASLYTSTTNGIYVWGGQLVEGTEALEYQYTNGKEGIPRIDFTDNTDGHLLLEPQRTNYVEYSNDASQWTDVVNNGTVTKTANYAVSPDGSQNATRLEASVSGSGFALILLATTTSFAGDYVSTVYVKSNTGSNQDIVFYGRNTDVEVHTATGEWTRIQFKGSSSSGLTNYAYVGISTGKSEEDNPIDILVWGGQLEQGTYPTSYIPTNGSTVTRDADTCTGAGSSADFNSEEGVLYVEFRTLSQLGTFRQINLYQDISNRIYISKRAENDNLEFRMDNPSGNLSFSFPTNTTNDFVKVAFRYGTNNFAVFIDGINKNVNSTGTTFTANTLDKLDLTSAISQDFYGEVKALRVYKEAKSDTDLENLTS